MKPIKWQYVYDSGIGIPDIAYPSIPKVKSDYIFTHRSGNNEYYYFHSMIGKFYGNKDHGFHLAECNRTGLLMFHTSGDTWQYLQEGVQEAYVKWKVDKAFEKEILK